jgi:integrase/recombinase XerD
MRKPKTVDEGIAEFAAHLARRPLSDNTRKAFLGDVRIFSRFMVKHHGAITGRQHVIGLSEITSDIITDFIRYLETGDIARSPKSVERRLTSLKVMFKWLYESGHLLRDPAESVAYKPFIDALPEYLSESETAAVIQAARTVAGNARLEMRPLTAIILVLDTGIKKGECLALRRDDIVRMDDGSTCIVVEYEREHLRFKSRSLVISEECRHALDAHIRQYAPVDFLFDCTGRNLEYLFNRKVAPLANMNALTFEMLRWTSAVRDYREGTMKAEQLQVKYGLSEVGWSEMEAKLVRLLQHGPQDLHSSEQAVAQ